MSVINKHITIPKNVSSGDDLDFGYLRQEGIAYIEQFGSRLWTDYNTHDPGITMLEVLCYALTDLGNRINMPVEDLLTRREGDDFQGQFYKASDILPSAPVTAMDYRKLITDIPGIRNCWVRKYDVVLYADLKQNKLSYNRDDFKDTSNDFIRTHHLKGFYKFLVDTVEDGPELSGALKARIFETYHANRNLCEQLSAVEQVKTYPLKVCASLEIAPESDEEYIQAQAELAIEAYFAPAPKFRSLKYMSEKGFPTEEIFEGPLLKHGFLDTEEMKKSELRREVRLSDIINLIMNIEGVKSIREITAGKCNGEEDEDAWLICIPEDTRPVLCEKTVFNFFKGVLPVNINKAQALKYKEELLEDLSEETSLAAGNMEPELPEGMLSDLAAYSSVQQDFPDTYGIGSMGLPPNAGPERKAKARQLKAYLLFFDQILAGYFKHLDQIKSVLSLQDAPQRTYFSQVVQDVTDIEALTDYPDDPEALADLLFKNLDDAVERRNQVLDHLIARFAEKFGNYAFLMKTLYGGSAEEIVLQNKQQFLQEYDMLSKNRGAAFNYYNQTEDMLWDTGNVSGVQKRIARLSGMRNYFRRNLSDSFVQIYVYNNISGKQVYRWRIRNAQNKIILSATESYPSVEAASREMHFAIVKILESDPRKVAEVLNQETGDEIDVENFCIHKTATSEKFSFDVVDTSISSDKDPDYIIAKQFIYYGSKKKVVEAIISLIDFFKTQFTEEGIFLVEHILLLPESSDDVLAEALPEYTKGHFLPFCADDYTDCAAADPYSYRVSIVLPGFTYRFVSKDFRDYMENLIREELPSHVLAKICWPGFRKGEEPQDEQFDVENPEAGAVIENQLVNFEKAYKDFLYKKTGLHLKAGEPESQHAFNEVLNEFIDALTGLHSIYPSGTLYDCEDEEEDIEGKIILGKTNLGSR